MTRLKRWLISTFGLLLSAAAAGDAEAADAENMLYIELESGRVVIHMLPDVAPNHVARIKQLARKGFYDGVVFHRVIPDFMAQTGDPTGTGTGGSGENIDAEFSRVPHVRGSASMARAQSENSADSQFFIVYEPAPFLDGKYTVWGQVVSGMEYIDAIKQGSKANNGQATDPDKMISVRVAADVKE